MIFYPRWDNVYAQIIPAIVPLLLFYITFLQVRQKMYLQYLSCGNYVLGPYMEWHLSVKKYIHRNTEKALFVKFIIFNI